MPAAPAFAWTSDRRLLSEVVRRMFAVFALALGGGLALLFSGHPTWGWALILTGAVAAAAVGALTPPTRIAIEGDTLRYGASQRVPLAGVRQASIGSKNHVGDVLIVQAASRRYFVPLQGVPADARARLLAAVCARIA